MRVERLRLKSVRVRFEVIWFVSVNWVRKVNSVDKSVLFIMVVRMFIKGDLVFIVIVKL